jgi:sulfur-carrier protein
MSSSERKIIHIRYYALLRESAGVPSEDLETAAATADELYREINVRHNLLVPKDFLRVSINDVFSSWQEQLRPGDRVAFIPPVSGG